MEQPPEYLKFYWKLENFCFCNLHCYERCSSPSFKVTVPYKSEWSLYMFPNGYGVENYIGIYLKRSENNSGPKEIRVSFRILVIDKYGMPGLERSYQDVIFKNDDEWGFNEFVRRRKLTPDSSFLDKDTLTILCNFKIIEAHPRLSSRSPSLEMRNKKESREICEALETLYYDSNYSDQILCGNPKRFNVHKCILHARLPDLLNKLIVQPDKIYCSDLVTEQVLLYAYTGKLDAKDFDFLDIRKLEEYGVYHLINRISSKPNVYVAKTYFTVKQHSISWTIRTSNLNNKDEIISPLDSDGSDDIGFKIFLTKDEEDSWKINIKIISDDDVFIRCKISLKDCSCFSQEYEFNKYVQCDTSIQLIDDNLLFNQNSVPYISDYFTLDFVFTYPAGDTYSNLDISISSFMSSTNCIIDERENLLMDLEELYHGRQEADFSVQAGNKVFRVHKCILSARSPVFQAMLKHDMQERNEDMIHMKSENLEDYLYAQLVDKLLLYVYCGKLEAPYEEFKEYLLSLIDMYYIGGKYEKIESVQNHEIT